ncbi:hypothetical protein HN903_02020 [archaeon]|jgi:hypothetical protein|nr:hypothetical protein [archaeon]MBT7128509.1 hypothetical protein [archaeon]
MVKNEINKLILEKLNKAKCENKVKELIKNLLEFERDSLNEDVMRYTDQYKNFVEHYARRVDKK